MQNICTLHHVLYIILYCYKMVSHKLSWSGFSAETWDKFFSYKCECVLFLTRKFSCAKRPLFWTIWILTMDIIRANFSFTLLRNVCRINIRWCTFNCILYLITYLSQEAPNTYQQGWCFQMRKISVFFEESSTLNFIFIWNFCILKA